MPVYPEPETKGLPKEEILGLHSLLDLVNLSSLEILL